MIAIQLLERAKKMQEGLGYQPQRGEQRQFGGYCILCLRIGHKEAQCCFKQEYVKASRASKQDSKQRDIRDWTEGE